MHRKSRTPQSILAVFTVTATLVAGTGAGPAAGEVLNLQRSLEMAMSNSPTIVQTELSLEQARENLNIQHARLKSNFSLSLNPISYSSDRTFNDFFNTWNTARTTQSSGTFTISQPIVATDGTFSLNNRLSWRNSYSEFQDETTRSYDNSLYLSYSQPLFTYNRTKLEIEELELDLQNTMYQYAMQKLTIENSVTQSFFSLYAQKMSLDIDRETLDNQRRTFEITKNKVDAGLLAEVELFQAEINMLEAELSLRNKEESFQNALDRFKLDLGMSINDSIDVDATVQFRKVDVGLDNALNSALKNRMELKQREISIQTAINSVIRSSAQNEFQGQINLSYGIIGTDEDVGNMFDSPTKRQQVGLSFDIPLWDWGERKSRIRSSELGVERQRLMLVDDRNDIIMNVRSAYRELVNLETQIDIAEKNIRNAQITYDIRLEEYQNGDLTSMQLNDYQTQLSNAKLSRVQTIIDYRLALLSMKILTLWDYESGEPVLPETDINTLK